MGVGQMMAWVFSIAFAMQTNACLAQSASDSFPARSIQIVVPFGACSGTDVTARLLGQHLQAARKQSVVADNRPGANGFIAGNTSTPDEYALLMGTNSTHGANSGLIAKLPYDQQRDFVPIGLVGVFSIFLVVDPALPVLTPVELVAYGKANPKALTFAAVTAQRIRDGGGPPLQGQLLWYSLTDYPTAIPNSCLAYGSGFGLTQVGIQWHWDQYLEDSSAASHPHPSPLRAVSTAGLPSAYVLVAEFDVLRDKGEAFARRLVTGGVEAVTRCWASMNQGFLKCTGAIGDADAAMADACAWPNSVLQRNSNLFQA